MKLKVNTLLLVQINTNNISTFLVTGYLCVVLKVDIFVCAEQKTSTLADTDLMDSPAYGLASTTTDKSKKSHYAYVYHNA